jgi:hypothetical protein
VRQRLAGARGPASKRFAAERASHAQVHCCYRTDAEPVARKVLATDDGLIQSPTPVADEENTQLELGVSEMHCEGAENRQTAPGIGPPGTRALRDLMQAATDEAKESNAVAPLRIRLTKIGEADRLLEFPTDAVRSVGSAANAHVTLSEPGILPIHCFLERHQGELWLLPGEGGELRVNYQPTCRPTRLAQRSILEVGEARLQVAIIDTEERSSVRGPYGTEIIEAPTRAADELPTTYWVRPAVETDALVATGELLPLVTPDEPVTVAYSLQPPELPGSYEQVRTRAAFEALTTTARMPRVETTTYAPTGLVAAPCLRVRAREEDTLPSATRTALSQAARESGPHPQGAANTDETCYLLSGATTSSPALGQPPRPASTPRFSQPGGKRFTVTRSRDPRLFAAIATMTLLSLAALASQAARTWPYVKEPLLAEVYRLAPASISAARTASSLSGDRR